ncbi:helix-turn-helix domain-containing protein [Dactylosporangium sp. NPDC051484]|uniref:winged helix-turn-helix transcriptional regulator n=1 Tax=Dactylosporangium sp. NPDC051484 TaxID=3154942 RepID=UPI00344C37D9
MRDPLPPDLFDPACPSAATPFQIGDKWAGMVLICLRDGPRRFGELRVPLRRVSAKVLAETLRALERDGMITRTVYDEIPPRVEYSITDLGHTLFPAMDACRAWAAEHLAAIESARAAYALRGA